jgi:TonB family protein
MNAAPLPRRRWLVLAGLALLPRVAAGGDPPDQAAKPKPGNRSPYLPPRAIAARMSGRVAVQFTITKAGTVRDVQVEGSSGFDFLDLSVAEAVREWRFEPALKGGKPVPTTARQSFYFSVPSEAEAALALEEANKMPPLWIGRGVPPLRQPPGKKLSARLQVLLAVDPDGWVHWARLTKRSGKLDADYLVLASAFTNWRFDLKDLRVPHYEPADDLPMHEFGRPPTNTVAFFKIPIELKP